MEINCKKKFKGFLYSISCCRCVRSVAYLAGVALVIAGGAPEIVDYLIASIGVIPFIFSILATTKPIKLIEYDSDNLVFIIRP